MAAPKFIEIDGKRFVWRDILLRRRGQRMAASRIEQPALFELKTTATRGILLAACPSIRLRQYLPVRPFWHRPR
jgi:hypothetical protein